MPKPSPFLIKIQREYEEKLLALRMEYEAKFAEERHFARVFQMDMVTIALGRMGWGEKRLSQLNDKLTEVVMDMGEAAKDESKYDPDLWVTMDKHEKELKRYAGKMYVPMNERYK